MELFLSSRSCFLQITNAQLHHYVGNYSSFLRARAARQLQASQAYKAKQAEIERLQVFVDRFGAKATKASAANSRKKMIEKIKQQMPDEAPPEGTLSSYTSKACTCAHSLSYLLQSTLPSSTLYYHTIYELSTSRFSVYQLTKTVQLETVDCTVHIKQVCYYIMIKIAS